MSGFAGIPTVMAALAAPYALNEFVAKPGFGIYSGVRGIIDDVNKRQDQELLKKNVQQAQANPDSYLQDYSQYNDVGTALENDKYIEYVKKRALEQGDLPLLNEIARREAAGNYSMEGLQATNSRGQAELNKFQIAGRDRQAYRTMIDGLQNVDSSTIADFALRNQDKLSELNKLATNIGAAKDKVTLSLELANINNQEWKSPEKKAAAIAKAFAKAPGAVDDVMGKLTTQQNADTELYSKTFGPMQQIGVGRTSSVGQVNKLGDFKKDVQSIAPVINIHGGGGGGTSSSDPGFQYFWTQSNPNAPPMLERVPINSAAYMRYMFGDLAQTGKVRPFGRKGQMTSGQAQGSFKYQPYDRGTVTVDKDNNVVTKTKTTSMPKRGGTATASSAPSEAAAIQELKRRGVIK